MDGTEAGLVTGFKNLKFVKVHTDPVNLFWIDWISAILLIIVLFMYFSQVKGAGHLVAMDQPRHAFEMFRRWTRGVPLGSSLSEEKPDEKQMNPTTVFLN